MKHRFILIVLILTLLTVLFSCTKDEKLQTEPDPMNFYSISYSDSIMTWTTDTPSRSTVAYGTDPDFLNKTAYSLEGETNNHSIIFLDLESSTTYYFKIKHRENKAVYYSSVKKFNSGTVWSADPLIYIAFIDVKQGDSEWIRTPSGENIVIDGGYGSYSSDIWAGNGEKISLNFLTTNSVSSIHSMILTHPHADHVGGLVDILESGISVNNVYNNNLSYSSGVYQDFLQAIALDPSINYYHPSLGSELSFSGSTVKMKLLNNNDQNTTGNVNNSSLTYHLTYKNFSAYFPGDTEIENIDKILDNYSSEVPSLVYKVSHHGSYNGTTRPLIAKMKPIIAYIPCGAMNPYGHPHQQTLTILEDYYVDVYRADINGTVEVLSDGENTITVTKEK